MVEVVFENFVNYLRSGNTDKLNIISFQQNQQHKINLSTQLIFDRILTKTVVQLNSNFIREIKQDYSISSLDCIKYFTELVNAGVKDIYEYPSIIEEIGKDVHYAFKQSYVAKQIIIAMQKKNTYDISLSYIMQNKSVQVLIQLIEIIKGSNNTQKYEYINTFFDDDHLINLFQLIRNIPKTALPNQLIYAAFYFFDEVCFRDIYKNPSTFNYSNMCKSIIQFMKICQTDAIITAVKQQVIESIKPSFNTHQLDSFNFLMSIIKTKQQLVLLIFPLTIFLKSSQEFQINDLINNLENLDDTTLCKSLKFIQEIANVQAFEAIMYRDLNYVIYSLNQKHTTYTDTFSKQLISCFLIQSYMITIENANTTPQHIILPIKSYLTEVKQFYENYQTNNITFFFSGTFCSLTNFVRYSTLLLSSSTSRGLKDRSVHSCPTPLPQFHPCKLGQNYYQFGIDSYKLVEPKIYFQKQFDNNYESSLLNLFYGLNPFSIRQIQSLYAQISPQLIIINPKNKKIIFTRSHSTFCIVNDNDQFLNKMLSSYMFYQLSIQKYKIEDKQIIDIQYHNEISSECSIQFSVEQGHSALIMQPLSQSNIPQLAYIGNYLIDQFCQNLIDNNNINNNIENIAKLLVSNIQFLGEASELSESLFTLHYMFICKYGIQSVMIQNMEMLLSQTMPEIHIIPKRKIKYSINTLYN
ncbi:Hypothetical_protein [Hexamita inflata]|uniref:Hypothetical_protein n=1 Tax=Hexamita inflata TaxID=28002 RepID=A0AA86TJ36_9EUKA|nr:Hypothetical protein HINF_LOCUS2253 [Hexamita inflata]